VVRKRERPWAHADLDELLQMRLCDLRVSLRGTALHARILEVLDELAARGIRFRPHFWISDEWFSPARVTGVAVPFYLTHPRLLRLERQMMLDAEGANHAECLRIIRHEVGHALDHAYRLSSRAGWQRHFGRSSRRYPLTYVPKPTSRNYVQHLAYWYAQAHPDEDFAETFAVWLAPGSHWRKRYEGWPALRKLEYVDALMSEIAGRRPLRVDRRKLDPIATLTGTLAEYYARKQRLYGTSYPDFYDPDLRRLFSDLPADRHKERAAAFIRRVGRDIRHEIAHWTGESQYTLAQVIDEIAGRCQELDLRVAGNPHRVKASLGIVLTMHTMTFLLSRPRRLAL
jgi:hypothetical protein